MTQWRVNDRVYIPAYHEWGVIVSINYQTNSADISSKRSGPVFTVSLDSLYPDNRPPPQAKPCYSGVDYATGPNQQLILPVGAMNDNLAELIPVVHDKSKVCDCGGFKTYNTMSPESHSGWCKSRSGQ